MKTALLIYAALSIGTLIGWLLRSLFALRDMRELDELRAAKGQRDAEVALLNRMSER